MMQLLRRLIGRVGGYRKQETQPVDFAQEKDFTEIQRICREHTMTSPERMFALHKAVNYIVANQIPGDFVECGVWRGGSAMNMALSLMRLGDKERQLWLYDTYAGMSQPTEQDVNIAGESAASIHAEQQDSNLNRWCYAPVDEVRRNLVSTGYPEANLRLVQGKVEDTIPNPQMPQQIALLRLDTDWFESTYHELTHLFPLVMPNGVIIIDDYGYWEGARKAVDQYFKEHRLHYLLNRIDVTGRLVIKT